MKHFYRRTRLNPSAKMPTTLRSCLIHSSEFFCYFPVPFPHQYCFSYQCPRVRNRFRIIIEQKWFGATRSPHQLVIESKSINFWLQLIVPSNFAKETVAQFAAVGQLVVPGYDMQKHDFSTFFEFLDDSKTFSKKYIL